MDIERLESNNPAMTFDELSMERSKSFVKALQELKNLRPQLYSAADYCEKSYLHSEQKQMVLDNLKDYAVKALVNAVDHLGTVASKLTDLFEQQSLDISTMDLRVSCVNQQLLTCRVYNDKEGFRQQQLLALIPRHHKHYILPNSVTKGYTLVLSGGLTQDKTIIKLYPISNLQMPLHQNHSPGIWDQSLKGTAAASPSSKDTKAFAKTSGVFHLLDDEESINEKPLSGSQSTITMQTYGVALKDLEVAKPQTAYKSIENPRQEIIQAPVRSKSVLSAFFVKQKTPKLKAAYVS